MVKVKGQVTMKGLVLDLVLCFAQPDMRVPDVVAYRLTRKGQSRGLLRLMASAGASCYKCRCKPFKLAALARVADVYCKAIQI